MIKIMNRFFCFLLISTGCDGFEVSVTVPSIEVKVEYPVVPVVNSNSPVVITRCPVV